jgi:hypothetical protein
MTRTERRLARIAKQVKGNYNKHRIATVEAHKAGNTIDWRKKRDLSARGKQSKKK